MLQQRTPFFRILVVSEKNKILSILLLFLFVSTKFLTFPFSLLNRLLDCEPYPLRQAVCDIISNILLNVLTVSSEDDEELNTGENNRQKAKEKFLFLLMKRILDKNAYCRAHILEILQELAEHNILPFAMYKLLFRSAVSRTRDTSALVRKRAMQLVRVIIQFYHKAFTTEERPVFATAREIENQLSLTEENIKALGLKLQEHQEALRRPASQQSHPPTVGKTDVVEMLLEGGEQE